MSVHAAPPLSALACIFCISCARPPAPAPEDRIAVRVRAPQSVRRPVEVAASGSVDPQDSSKLAFQIAGRVTRVLVEEGATVRRGQVLAELDPADYQHGLEATLAQADAARANQNKALAGTRVQELEQARIAYERAADEYRRMRLLFERQSLAPNDFNKVEAAYHASAQRYAEAREGARAEDKEAAAAVVRQAEANVAVSRKRVADTRLAAPLSGTIARRMADPGDTIAAGYPIFLVMDLDPARIRVGIPEAEIGRVRLHQPAAVTFPAFPGQVFEGRVSLAGVAADPVSRTYTVKIDVPNSQRLLRAGMIAEARIRSDATIAALTIPGDAVVTDPQGATLVYVYFPARERVYSRRIETGSVYGREVEVRKGLDGGEQVVVAGQNRVREGSLVAAAQERP